MHTLPDMLQTGQALFAADDLNAALYWFKFVTTWAPSSFRAEITSCEAAGAVATLTVRRRKCCCLGC